MKSTKTNRSSKNWTKRKQRPTKMREIENLCYYVVDSVREEAVDVDGNPTFNVSWKGYSRQEDSWIPKLPSFFESKWKLERKWGGSTWIASAIPLDSDLDVLACVACLQDESTWIAPATPIDSNLDVLACVACREEMM
jgi:hypothetical protein